MEQNGRLIRFVGIYLGLDQETMSVCALQRSIVVRHNDIISLWGDTVRYIVIVMQWKKMDRLRNRVIYLNMMSHGQMRIVFDVRIVDLKTK